MFRRFLLASGVAVLGLSVVATPAVAQEFGFDQGTVELQFAGSGGSDEEFDNTTLAFDAGINYFIADQLSIGVDLQGQSSDTVGGSSSRWGVGGVIDYNLPLGRFQPFIGAGVGYLFGDDFQDTWYAGPEAGLKIFLTEDAYFYGSVQYQFLFDEGDVIDEVAEDGRFWYGFGIGVAIGPNN